MRFVVIGCGGVGGTAARRVAASGAVDDLVVADVDAELVEKLAADLGAEAARCDARDPGRLAEVFAGADVVFNAVGPFHRFALPIVQAAIDAGAHYVDINDDFDVAEALVRDERWDRAAKSAGVTVLTGAGVSPGLTNLLARWASDQLDSTSTVEVLMAVPFQVNMGRTINDHMFHCVSGVVTQFLDGDYRKVPAGSDRRRFQLQPPFGSYEFGFMGHSESITVPRFIPGLHEATTRFTWLQDAGNHLYETLDELGLMSDERGDLPMSPRAFLSEYTASPAGEAALGIDITDAPLGAVWQVVANGSRNGLETSIVMEAHYMYGDSQDGDTLTAVPAAAMIGELLAGRITETGVLAPEGCIDPVPFVQRCCDEIGITLHRRTVITEALS